MVTRAHVARQPQADHRPEHQLHALAGLAWGNTIILAENGSNDSKIIM
jgi:hypothetical protein